MNFKSKTAAITFSIDRDAEVIAWEEERAVSFNPLFAPAESVTLCYPRHKYWRCSRGRKTFVATVHGEFVDQKSPAFGKRCLAIPFPLSKREEKRRAPEISSFLPRSRAIGLVRALRTATNHAIPSSFFLRPSSTHPRIRNDKSSELTKERSNVSPVCLFLQLNFEVNFYSKKNTNFIYIY